MKRPWYDWSKIQPWVASRLNRPGVSQTKIARKIGISDTLLSLAKTGERSLCPAKTHQLMRALGYEPRVILRSLGIAPHRGPLMNERTFSCLMRQLGEDGMVIIDRTRVKRLRAVFRKIDPTVRGQRYLMEKLLREVFEHRLRAVLGRNR